MVAVIVLWVTVIAFPATNHRNGVDGLCRVQDRLYGEDCFTIYCFFTPRVSVAVFVLPVDAYLDFVQITESHAASPLRLGGSEIFAFP